VADFADTAAIMAQLDLVIAADTSCAHLAAGMGVPTWLLSRKDACWRWMRQRDDSPWYPSMRIFRQHTAGDWTSVIIHLAQSLSKLREPPS
jgi:ADP-heptose:LPS heptosyltransferase